MLQNQISTIWSRKDGVASVSVSFIHSSSALRLNRILFDPYEVVQHQNYERNVMNTVTLPKSDYQGLQSF